MANSLREAAQKALEALDIATTTRVYDEQEEILAAYDGLRKALAQPEQESKCKAGLYEDCNNDFGCVGCPEQEPVAWSYSDELKQLKQLGTCNIFVQHNPHFFSSGFPAANIPLYTRPQPSIPEGWKLVPIEPTEEQKVMMSHAAYLASCHDIDMTLEEVEFVYRRALEAAPQYSPGTL